MKEYQNYIFDLDGTIINSAEEVLKCLDLALEKTGYKVEKSRFVPTLIGPPIRQIMKNLAPEFVDEQILETAVKHFRNIYDNDTEDISFLYDGIENLLQNLKNEGKRLFIATFKPLKPTLRILEEFNISKYFDDVYCIDKFERTMTKGEMISDILSKYNLKNDETVMIGDSKSDMTAAKDGNVTGMGVLWGYDADKTALQENADIIVEKVEDIKTVRTK